MMKVFLTNKNGDPLARTPFRAGRHIFLNVVLSFGDHDALEKWEAERKEKFPGAPGGPHFDKAGWQKFWGLRRPLDAAGEEEAKQFNKRTQGVPRLVFAEIQKCIARERSIARKPSQGESK